jgi:hypothetical protein
MIDELIPNISKHFLFSILEKNQRNSLMIIDTVSKLDPLLIEEFLYLFTNNLTSYFHRLETGLPGFERMRVNELQHLKNSCLEDSLEGSLDDFF